MKALELKIPPVAVFLVLAILMFAIHSVDSTWLFIYIPLKVIWVVLLVAASGYVGISGVYEFKRAKTTVDPTRPDKASQVVDSGIFSLTRNPMYVALYCLLLAWGIWLEDVLSLLTSVLFVLYINRFQIQPEERALTRMFGEQYLDYKARVRRWI
ncbi:hypothetical protein BCU70_06730 [Vibrio sp. 10N.286.49.C2]|uniref:methyltransferase family protein n=1 Tax=unclassified Vibrio TaxID=2614977 RepID=UPI000C833CDB|nr:MULTISPECIES: isoprenylcysteine carboxylmethyltransferase family protein [unclassified Vibrio]PMH31582.1 hypothetical protein BCU70_06730 [Vibrio sp. 10N.286.49.C2]PMH50604.1 hypothetical protein BCU66_19090 [Vibrio sp. 10N.286.49.B1]PMH81468.1 hypothetical protein BCU58_21275 [Vibrio sp. 10N.286.48.B7]